MALARIAHLSFSFLGHHMSKLVFKNALLLVVFNEFRWLSLLLCCQVATEVWKCLPTTATTWGKFDLGLYIVMKTPLYGASDVTYPSVKLWFGEPVIRIEDWRPKRGARQRLGCGGIWQRIVAKCEWIFQASFIERSKMAKVGQSSLKGFVSNFSTLKGP